MRPPLLEFNAKPVPAPSKKCRHALKKDRRRQLQAEFEQPHFERQRLLHVRLEQPLRRLQHVQIFQRLTRVDPAGDALRCRQIREIRNSNPTSQATRVAPSPRLRWDETIRAW
jgi:hypothetical protein